MGVYLYNTQKNAYLGIDHRNCSFLTTDPRKAKVFSQVSAENYRTNQLKKVSGEFVIVDNVPDLSTPAETATSIPSDHYISSERYMIPAVGSLRDNPHFSKALQELYDKRIELEHMMTDIYHYAYLHPKLSASKGYKLYCLLREVTARRAKVKKQINALLQCEEQTYDYKPRSALFDHLSDLL